MLGESWKLKSLDKSNEITAIPEFIKILAVKGVVFAFDSMNTQKKQLV